MLKEIIETRRSIFPKDYLDEDISQEILDEILNAANYAPNHKRTKPWRFRVFKGEEKLNLGKELQRLYKEITPEQFFLQKKILKIRLIQIIHYVILPTVYGGMNACGACSEKQDRFEETEDAYSAGG